MDDFFARFKDCFEWMGLKRIDGCFVKQNLTFFTLFNSKLLRVATKKIEYMVTHNFVLCGISQYRTSLKIYQTSLDGLCCNIFN